MTERSYSDQDADSTNDDEMLIRQLEARLDREGGADAHNLDTFGADYLEEYPTLPPPGKEVRVDSYTSKQQFRVSGTTAEENVERHCRTSFLKWNCLH